MTGYEEKYKVLRESIKELAATYGNEQSMKSIVEIAKMTDRLEMTESNATTPSLTKEEIMSEKNTKKRINLIRENSNLFKEEK